MITDINGVPAAFFGFKNHEEEIDEIKKAIGTKIYAYGDASGGFNIIANALDEAGIHNVVFVVDQDVCITRVCEKYMLKDMAGHG